MLPISRTAGETTTETITLGFYADQVFGWKDRRFLDVGVRVDNNSVRSLARLASAPGRSPNGCAAP